MKPKRDLFASVCMIMELEWSGIDMKRERNFTAVIMRISDAVIGLMKIGVYIVVTVRSNLAIIFARFFSLKVYMTV